MSPSIEYPIVLAEFEFHGEKYQIWNDRERLVLVHQTQWIDTNTWEVLLSV
jgi:hypothetical protein